MNVTFFFFFLHFPTFLLKFVYRMIENENLNHYSRRIKEKVARSFKLKLIPGENFLIFIFLSLLNKFFSNNENYPFGKLCAVK